MCGNNGDPFIATLHNVLLAPDLCNILFSIIKLMNSGHTYLLNNGFCNVYFGAREKNAVPLPRSAKRKHAFLGKIREISKTKKLPARKKFSLELLHQRLGHRSTRSFLAGDTDNVWEDKELRINPHPFFKSCQIYSMIKKARYKNPMNPKSPFKRVFMYIIPSTAPKILTSEIVFIIIF